MKTAKSGIQIFEENAIYVGDCIVWAGELTRYGYGKLKTNTGSHTKSIAAHKFAWELHNGPVPYGLELDHVCRNKACVNHGHLEPVSHLENVRRASRLITHCPKGHPYDEKNTCFVKSKTGFERRCRACRRDSMRKIDGLHNGPAFVVERRKS